MLPTCSGPQCGTCGRHHEGLPGPDTCWPKECPHGPVVGTVIVCTRGQRRRTCEQCRARTSSRQCDYPLKGPKGGTTCDRYLCDRCAVRVGPNRDYCGVHARMAEAAK